jgi:hypothetical protein
MRFLDLKDSSSNNTFVTNISHACGSGEAEFNVVKVSAAEVILEKNDEAWIYHVQAQRLEPQFTATPSP